MYFSPRQSFFVTFASSAGFKRVTFILMSVPSRASANNTTKPDWKEDPCPFIGHVPIREFKLFRTQYGGSHHSLEKSSHRQGGDELNDPCAYGCADRPMESLLLKHTFIPLI